VEISYHVQLPVRVDIAVFVWRSVRRLWRGGHCRDQSGSFVGMSSEIEKIKSEYTNLLLLKDNENRTIKKVYEEIANDDEEKSELATQKIISNEKIQTSL
jgi:hypothetical protein